MIIINDINIKNSLFKIEYSTVQPVMKYKCNENNYTCEISTDQDATDLSICQTNCIEPPPSKKILGVWTETIGCGDTSFDIISLASSLPKDYIDNYDKFFGGPHGPIGGYYKDIKNSNVTYFISVGGLNASPSGWELFLNKLNTDDGLNDFINACNCRNIKGIDWDIEEFNDTLVILLKNISIKLKNAGFKIMLTILLGHPEWFKELFSSTDDSYYDYVTLMLYNGGMYKSDTTGAGCDWDGWAELFLSNGTAGCNNPLKYPTDPVQTYMNNSNLQNINTKKIVLGLRNDNAANIPATLETYKKADELVKKYDAAGIFYWVLHVGVSASNMNEILEYVGNPIVENCDTLNMTCPPTDKPCSSNSTCVASFCGKMMQSIKDSDCNNCKSNPTSWPCSLPGFCEEELTYPGESCLKYMSSSPP